mgnify:CR=1 FL=1
MAVTGMRLGGEIQEALGLPQDTPGILINIGLDEPITVWCRYFPSEEAMRSLVATLSPYQLIPGPDMPEGIFTQDQRIRLFRQGILRGEVGAESPFLKRYLACKEELGAYERLVEQIPHGIDTRVLSERIATLRDQLARMEAGEAH